MRLKKCKVPEDLESVLLGVIEEECYLEISVLERFKDDSLLRVPYRIIP